MVMGFTGAAFLNQLFLPRGAMLVVIDCTSCVYGRKQEHAQVYANGFSVISTVWE